MSKDKRLRGVSFNSNESGNSQPTVHRKQLIINGNLLTFLLVAILHILIALFDFILYLNMPIWIINIIRLKCSKRKDLPPEIQKKVINFV